MLNKLQQGAVIFAALFLFAGCVASKDAHVKRLMFQGIDSMQNLVAAVPELKIQKGDLLTILIYSDSKEATEIFNQPQTGGASGNMASGGTMSNQAATGRGYLVDPQGQIYIHSVGLLNVEGMTKKQLSDTLQVRLRDVLQGGYIIVRNANAKVTILGEVSKPGMIEFPDQRLSVLDAIGLAGDMTAYGRRDNVLVIRDEKGKKQPYRIDLRSGKLYESPVFYLEQNDLVYIEPNRKKPTGNEVVLMRNVAILTSVLSAVTIIVSLITR